MPRFRHFLIFAVVGSVQISGALGQCAKAVVMVRGHVENSLSSTTQMGVTVVVKTPKGDFPKSTELVDGQFSVDVPFSTLKSYTILWGHRCSNLPKFVILKVTKDNQTLAERVLDFKKSFQQQALNRYETKQDLTIDLSKPSSAKP